MIKNIKFSFFCGTNGLALFHQAENIQDHLNFLDTYWKIAQGFKNPFHNGITYLCTSSFIYVQLESNVVNSSLVCKTNVERYMWNFDVKSSGLSILYIELMHKHAIWCCFFFYSVTHKELFNLTSYIFSRNFQEFTYFLTHVCLTHSF